MKSAPLSFLASQNVSAIAISVRLASPIFDFEASAQRDRPSETVQVPATHRRASAVVTILPLTGFASYPLDGGWAPWFLALFGSSRGLRLGTGTTSALDYLEDFYTTGGAPSGVDLMPLQTWNVSEDLFFCDRGAAVSGETAPLPIVSVDTYIPTRFAFFAFVASPIAAGFFGVGLTVVNLQVVLRAE